MSQLGKPVVKTYMAKNLRTGLDDIVAYVRKPSGTFVGPFPCTEIQNPFFVGMYQFSFMTDTENDDNGDYVGVFVSPTENHRVGFVISYEQISVSELTDITNEVNKTIRLLNQTDLEIDFEDEEEIELEFDEVST